MNANTSNQKNNSQRSSLTRKTKARNKWTFWPSLLLLFFSLDILVIINLFMLIEGLFDKVNLVIPGVWGAFTLFIAFLGIGKSRKTTMLSLLRLPPTGMIIILYTIITLMLVSYLYLTGIKEHEINVTTLLDGKNQARVEIYWDGKFQARTSENGMLTKPIVSKSGDYYLTGKFGSIIDSNRVQISWMPPFTHFDTIRLASPPVDVSQLGQIKVIVLLDNVNLDEFELVVDDNLYYSHPGTIELSQGEHIIKAKKTLNGFVYSAEKSFTITTGYNNPITLNLIRGDRLPATLKIKASFEGEEITGAEIILNNRTLSQRTPATISGLIVERCSVKVIYFYNTVRYEGTESVTLLPGQRNEVEVTLNQMLNR